MASFQFDFEELPAIVLPDGTEGALQNGSAEVRYFRDGEWGIGTIWVDGFRKNADGKFDRVPVELEFNVFTAFPTLHGSLYLAIYEQLTEGRFKAHVQAKVLEQLAKDRVPQVDINAEHRLTARELV